MADVARNLLRRGTKTRNGIGNDQVDLACVGLSGHIIAGREPELFAEKLIQLVALGRVALEDFHEARLCAGSALGAAELQFASYLLDAVKVEHEVLRPLCCSLSNGDELSCLKMRIRKSRFS